MEELAEVAESWLAVDLDCAQSLFENVEAAADVTAWNVESRAASMVEVRGCTSVVEVLAVLANVVEDRYCTSDEVGADVAVVLSRQEEDMAAYACADLDELGQGSGGSVGSDDIAVEHSHGS